MWGFFFVVWARIPLPTLVGVLLQSVLTIFQQPTMELEYANEVRLFNKWPIEDVHVKDPALKDVLPVGKRPVFVPHTAGRYQRKAFRKIKCPIVERLVNSLMMHGRNNGKKL